MLASLARDQQNRRTVFSFVLVLGLTAQGVVAQDAPASPALTSAAPLTWQRLVHLHDGRTFVSDGPFTLDAALAKPAVLPSHVLPETTAKLVEGYLTAELPDEFASSQLTRRGDNYTTPSGILLNRLYVDYLRRTMPGSRLRFRMKSDSEPVVILGDGRAVGLLMPMKR